MASNDAKLVNFSITWKIDCSEFDKLGDTKIVDRNQLAMWCPRKHFITAHNNIVFHWSAILTRPPNSVGTHRNRVLLPIAYKVGPLNTIDGAVYKGGVVKRDGSIELLQMSGNSSGKGRGFLMTDVPDSAAVRAKYQLQESDSLRYQISIRIPMEAFAYAPAAVPIPVPNPILTRHADRFGSIQNPENAKFSDAILVSCDDVEFYCHKVIVGQSESLETLLSDPLAGLEKRNEQPPAEGRGMKRKATTDSDESDKDDGEEGTSTIEDTTAKVQRGYKFKEMATSSLKAMIEYLYTGQSTLTNLTVTEILQVANAAEMYQLKPLKQSCIVVLWKRVVDEPRTAFEIARFADLHDDWKYLKHRAFDVIVENYQKLNVKPSRMPDEFGGTRGEELTDALVDHMAQRRCPDIGPW